MPDNFARVDLDRAVRCGRAETIFSEGKLPHEVAAIAQTLRGAGQPVLATRATRDHFEAVAAVLPDAVWHERAHCITVGRAEPSDSRFSVAVVGAGTTDLPVAEEAMVTLEAFGQKAELIVDVGVAGLHRLLAEVPRIRACGVAIVVAGMEGALPSVVAGLIDRPVIGVPTSVGYGANLGGVAALLGMLTSCGSRVTVVNIDNGFGAACAADAMLRMAGETES